MPTALPEPALRAVTSAARSEGKVVVLTGAGISGGAQGAEPPPQPRSGEDSRGALGGEATQMQESGIPTFRGPGGYWTVGSVNYRSEDLATRAAFERMPEDIWAWYIHRRSVCRAAAPNAAHRSLVALEELLHDRFVLVTQNVDGLHLLAGNTLTRTLEIHGNTDYIRCSRACVWKMPDAVMLFPEGLPATWEKGRPLGEEEKALLKCPRCGKWARPHVLWFDEVYDQPLFRARSALAAVEDADLLIVVRTSGKTSLPQQIVARMAGRRRPVLLVDKEETEFWEYAWTTGGADLRGSATEWVPAIVEAFVLSSTW